MMLTEIKQRKRELGLTNEMIADASGVPLSTVQKIFSGATKSPRRLTLDAIAAVLRQPAAAEGTPVADRTPRDAASSKGQSDNRFSFDSGQSASTILRESPAYSSAALHKEYHTLDDYYDLPDTRRAELIDGVFYDMAAPSFEHQEILGMLYMLFWNCIEAHHSDCRVLMAPVDVRLDKDDDTMVQPDLVILCHDYDPRGLCFEGAPDLVVEILSPSSRSLDQLLKLNKYQRAGVREYWIVDPRFRRVTVHRFEDEEYAPEQYPFDARIPIGISGGSCSIDFSRILERLAD